MQKQLEGIKIPNKALVPDGGLIGHKIKGGHSIERHFKQTPTQMAERIIKENRKVVSTFIDFEKAEYFVAETLRANKAKIDVWLKEMGKGTVTLEFESRFEQPVGRLLKQGQQHSSNVQGCRVVLKSDSNVPSGYSIKTAYPVDK